MPECSCGPDGCGQICLTSTVQFIPASLFVDIDQFTRCGEPDDPEARLLAPVNLIVNGCSVMLHLELLAVDDDGDPVIYPEHRDALYNISNPDERFTTIKLPNGRNYLAYATPYQD